jgi:hypothetical protein
MISRFSLDSSHFFPSQLAISGGALIEFCLRFPQSSGSWSASRKLGRPQKTHSQETHIFCVRKYLGPLGATWTNSLVLGHLFYGSRSAIPGRCHQDDVLIEQFNSICVSSELHIE